MTREILKLKIARTPKSLAPSTNPEPVKEKPNTKKPAKVSKPVKTPPPPKRVRIEPEPKINIELATALFIDKYRDMLTSGYPLSKGCVNELTLDGYSKTTIRRIISSYVNMEAYYGLVLSSYKRFDGSPITDSEKEYARKELKRIRND